MKKYIVVGLLGLSACTFAVNNPERFDKAANKTIKEYKKNRHDLYACFVGQAAVPSDLAYQTPTQSIYEKRGLVKVIFQDGKKGHALMTVQTVKGG